MNGLSKAGEQLFPLREEGIRAGSRRSHELIRPTGFKSKNPPSPRRGRGTHHFKFVQSQGHPSGHPAKLFKSGATFPKV
jgi:hypothetical protein